MFFLASVEVEAFCQAASLSEDSTHSNTPSEYDVYEEPAGNEGGGHTNSSASSASASALAASAALLEKQRIERAIEQIIKQQQGGQRVFPPYQVQKTFPAFYRLEIHPDFGQLFKSNRFLYKRREADMRETPAVRSRSNSEESALPELWPRFILSKNKVNAFCKAAASLFETSAYSNTRGEYDLYEEREEEGQRHTNSSASSASASALAASATLSEKQRIERAIEQIIKQPQGGQPVSHFYHVQEICQAAYCLEIHPDFVQLFTGNVSFKMKTPVDPQLRAALENVFGKESAPAINEFLIALEWELEHHPVLCNHRYPTAFGINPALDEFKRLVLGRRFDARDSITKMPNLKDKVYWQRMEESLTHISSALKKVDASYGAPQSARWRKLKTLFAAFLTAIAGALVAVHLGAVGGLTIAGYAVGSAAVGAISYLTYSSRYAAPVLLKRQGGSKFVDAVKKELTRHTPEDVERRKTFSST
jgi:hypothetical protein